MPYAGESWGVLWAEVSTRLLTTGIWKNPPRAHLGIASISSPAPGTFLSSSTWQKFVLIAAHPQSFHSEELEAGLKFILLNLPLTLFSPAIESKPNTESSCHSCCCSAACPTSCFCLFSQKCFYGMICEMNETSRHCIPLPWQNLSFTGCPEFVVKC